jgi:gliding motility-associated lipoprotein GldK
MKRILIIGFVMSFLLSCGGGDKRGELVGVERSDSWVPDQPHGMVKIPSGSFTMGATDHDLATTHIAPTKTVSVSTFWMDETEVSNTEYRQFVYWVRDSIIRDTLALAAYEEAGNNGVNQDGEVSIDPGLVDFQYVEIDTAENYYFQYLLEKQSTSDANNSNMNGRPYGRVLNWDVDLIWETRYYPSKKYAAILDYFYLPEEERVFGERILDTRKLKFKTLQIDIRSAAKSKVNGFDQHKLGVRSNHIINEDVAVYPDTTVWDRDFSFSYNTPMHRDYFWHPAFDNYPVVGVNFNQAEAFCVWRTNLKNNHLKSVGKATVMQYRLPTESEWEYAARGGIEFGTYPWGGPYTEDEEGCFMANFKPMRGDYIADGALYTVQVDAYYPNDYGLYNMAGNVSEWTNSAYEHTAYGATSTLNPDHSDEDNSKKVIRGGSWKDIAYYIQVSTREYEYKDTSRAYIGFRTVQSTHGNGAN